VIYDKYDQQDIAILAAELRRFSQAVMGGPHDRAADVLLELYDEVDRRGRLLAEQHEMYRLKSRENDRYRRLLNLKSLPLLRHTADADINTLVALHNDARQQASWAWTLPPLAGDATLMKYAQEHANWMSDHGRLVHSSMRKLMQLGFTAAGENIAWGQKTPASVMQSWLWSPGHRRNIMSRTYTKLGCGVAQDNKNRLYWCVCFGRD
jgi:uncharacterized protein YkwD